MVEAPNAAAEHVNLQMAVFLRVKRLAAIWGLSAKIEPSTVRRKVRFGTERLVNPAPLDGVTCKVQRWAARSFERSLVA